MLVGSRTLPPQPGGPFSIGLLAVDGGAAAGGWANAPREEAWGIRGGRPLNELLVRARGLADGGLMAVVGASEML